MADTGKGLVKGLREAQRSKRGGDDIGHMVVIDQDFVAGSSWLLGERQHLDITVVGQLIYTALRGGRLICLLATGRYRNLGIRIAAMRYQTRNTRRSGYGHKQQKCQQAQEHFITS